MVDVKPQLKTDSTMAEFAATETFESSPVPTAKSESTSPDAEDQRSIPETKHEYITGLKLYTVLAAATVVSFLVMLDMVILGVAVPVITNEFHSLADVGWYGSAYQLSSASLQPLAGKLFTHLSSKWVYLVFFFVFEIGSLVCALATTSTMLIIGRAIAGMGSSGLLNGALTILGGCAPKEQQPALIGILLATSQIGIAIGPTLGGVFTQYVNWRWCFWINLPIGGLVGIILLFIHIPDQITKVDLPLRKLIPTLDLIGFAFFLPFSVMFFLALDYGGNQFSWNSPTIIGLFVGSGCMLVIFFCWEWRVGDEAMLPISMMKKRVVWSSCATRFFYMGDIIVLSYYLPIYFQTVKGVSPVRSGYYGLPVVLIQMVLAVVSSLLVTKFGYYLPWIIACGVVMAIGDGLYSTLRSNTPTATWIGYEIVSGIGNGLGSTIPIIAIQSALPASDQSIAMALLIFSQNFGGAVFLTIAETIFTNSLPSLIVKYVHGVDVQGIIAAGATGWRDMLSMNQIEGVQRAYAESIGRTFYMAVGTSIGVLSFACAMGWVDIREKKDANEDVEYVSAGEK